jgi:ornithine decarboxylase
MYKKTNTLCYRRYFSYYSNSIIYNNNYLADVPVSYNTLSDNPVLFNTNHIHYNNDILKIINKHKSNEPFIIFHPNNIIKKINQWSLLLPGITPYYALKCNPDKKIIDIMKNFNMHYDCASKNEIKKILTNNIIHNKIIFANPSKNPDHIQYAKNKNINLLTFDSFNELHKIKALHPSAKLLLRIKVDDSKSSLKFSSKFGVDITDVSKLLLLAKVLELNIIGISFHVGSRCNDIDTYTNALQLSRQVFNIGLKCGYKFSMINIGGGFSGTDDYTFQQIAKTINTNIDKYFNKNSIDFIAEPGRYFAESAYTIVVKVINKKSIIDNNKLKILYFINEGVYGCFNNLLTDKANIKINTFKPYNQNIKSTIFGPSCDALDCIASNIELPELEIGDYIYIENMGAYTAACGTNFNGFNMARVKYIL